uniref:Reverse transcriptase n=1 Tax=Digenea simplex TaxID=945030 RepID=A0A4D6I7U5_DIGSM|nr:reverse transcriptase [Digenea simplex]
MFIAKAAAQQLIIEGADVSNAYLYGDIEIPILMEKPTNSSMIEAKPGYMCQLKKSLYGAKQAGEIWGEIIHSKFIEWGFQQSTQDQRLYMFQRQSTFIVLILVVGDMAFASNDRQLISTLKSNLSATFKVKLLGQLKSFIGWELTYSTNGISVNQHTYINRMLEMHNLKHIKPVSTPLPLSCDLTPTSESDDKLAPTYHNKYRSLIGSLSYISICTRPDISFAVSLLARNVHAPCIRH